MAAAPDLVLVDGSSYLYRAFHALPPLSNSRGEPTGAVLGVLNMLLKFIREWQPLRIAVVFDASGRTFRDDLFAEYKAHRMPMPDDLRPQIAPLLAVLDALGMPVLRIEGVEADDVIGTLACRAAASGERVLISTSDKDMAQLVSEHITLINTMSNTSLDVAGVQTRFEVSPAQIIDYLALVGDSSDNIPGIDKVGPKTAARLLAKYGTLDELIAHREEIAGKVGENLRAGLATLELSRRLATIRTDLDLELPASALEPRAPDVPRLRELYTRLELRALLRQLDEAEGGAGAESGSRAAAGTSAGATGAPAPGSAETIGAAPARRAPEIAIEIVLEPRQLAELVARLRAAGAFALHVETSSGAYMQGRIAGIALAVDAQRAAYLPLGHSGPGVPDQLGLEAGLDALRPLLEDPASPKIGVDLKRQAHALHRHGIVLAGMQGDTALESYVLDSVRTRHDLGSDAVTWLGIEPLAREAVTGKGARQLGFDQVPLEQAAAYACGQAAVALQLHTELSRRLAATPQLERLYQEIERPLAPVLLRMEERGVLIDREQLRAQSREFERQLQSLQQEAQREAGTDINLDSPKQLQQVLFERLQLPVTRRTPTGQPSTAEDVLEELAGRYPLPRIVLEYRALAKLKSTYTDKLPELVDAATGRIHTCYHQAVAQTGRLSSSDPNLQNIPIRRPEGRRIRQAFIAPPGYLLLAADYSQIELRIMAHLSGDEGLLSAFAEGRDVHQATAAEVFGVPLGEVSADQRRLAKTINFGLIYGMSPFGLSRQLGIERSAAQQYVERYFQRYPGVRRFMDTTREQARATGFVETALGRRLYLPDIRSGNTQTRQYAERSAINAPMQGTAADIIKRAMIEVDDWCERERVPARLIMQVHDELVLEVHADAVEAVAGGVRDRMVRAAQLRVALQVDLGRGNNWDQAH